MHNDVVRVRARAVHRDGYRRTVWLKIQAGDFQSSIPHLREAGRALVARCNPQHGSLELWAVYDVDAFH